MDAAFRANSGATLRPMLTVPRSGVGSGRRRSGPALRLLVPLALGGLVVWLAVLQYRWLGQVSEVERQEMGARLDRSAREFASEFNNEIGALYRALLSVRASASEDVPAAVASAYGAWRANARFAGLVKALFITPASGPRDLIDRLDVDRGTLDTVSWPLSLAPVIGRLSARSLGDLHSTSGAYVQVLAVSGSPFVGSIPALIVWLPDRSSRAPRVSDPGLPTPLLVDMFVQAPISRDALIVEFDRDYLRTNALPVLLDRHFGKDPAGTRIEIADASGSPVISRGVPNGGSIAAADADVALSFFIPSVENAAPFELARWVGRSDARAAGEVSVRPEPQPASAVSSRLAADSWHLRVQHEAGSLDAAVALGRRRNLALSFGILSYSSWPWRWSSSTPDGPNGSQRSRCNSWRRSRTNCARRSR